MPLTIAREEPAVLQFAVFRGSFACGSLHKKMILAVRALGWAIIQWRTLLVEWTPRLVPVRLTFSRQKSGTVFGVARLERPVRIGLLDSSLPWWWGIIWIHGGHIAVWDARICVHTDKKQTQKYPNFFFFFFFGKSKRHPCSSLLSFTGGHALSHTPTPGRQLELVKMIQMFSRD